LLWIDGEFNKFSVYQITSISCRIRTQWSHKWIPLVKFCYFDTSFSVFFQFCHYLSPVIYNRLTVFHKFHVLCKASKDKVMTGSISGVKKAVSIIDCWATSPSIFDENEENFDKTSQPRLSWKPCQSCQGWHGMWM